MPQNPGPNNDIGMTDKGSMPGHLRPLRCVGAVRVIRRAFWVVQDELSGPAPRRGLMKQMFIIGAVLRRQSLDRRV